MTAQDFIVNQPEMAQLLANKFKTTLPTAGQPLTDGVQITGTGRAQYLNISFRSAVSSTLSYTITRGGVADDATLLNGGTAIAAGVLYEATILVAPGSTVNFTYGDTGGIYTLYVGSVVQNG